MKHPKSHLRLVARPVRGKHPARNCQQGQGLSGALPAAKLVAASGRWDGFFGCFQHGEKRECLTAAP